MPTKKIQILPGLKNITKSQRYSKHSQVTLELRYSSENVTSRPGSFMNFQKFHIKLLIRKTLIYTLTPDSSLTEESKVFLVQVRLYI